MQKKPFQFYIVFSIILTGCQQITTVLENPKDISRIKELPKEEQPTQNNIVPPPKPSLPIEPDLAEQQFKTIEILVLDDIKRESILRNKTITLLEIIPSSSGNTRVLIQFMTHVKELAREYSCGYVAWFYQKDGIWNHEKYRTDDSNCEFSI